MKKASKTKAESHIKEGKPTVKLTSLQAYRKLVVGSTLAEAADQSKINIGTLYNLENKEEIEYPIRSAMRLAQIYDLSEKEIFRLLAGESPANIREQRQKKKEKRKRILEAHEEYVKTKRQLKEAQETQEIEFMEAKRQLKEAQETQKRIFIKIEQKLKEAQRTVKDQTEKEQK